MKKLKMILLTLPLTLASCGNRTVFDTTYKYNHMHVYATNTCYDVKSWCDYADGEQLQVTIVYDGKESTMLVSSVSVALIKGDCPFNHQ